MDGMLCERAAIVAFITRHVNSRLQVPRQVQGAPGTCCSPSGTVEPVWLPAVQIQSLFPALVHKRHAAAERDGGTARSTFNREWRQRVGGAI